MSEGTNPAEPKTPKKVSEPEAWAELPSRRKFIAWALGVPGVVITCLMCIPLVREALYPVFTKGSGTGTWSGLGPADQFASLTTPVRKVINLQTVDGWRQVEFEKVVYVTKGADGKLEVLSAVCPHLGCEVAWQASADRFHCPCHGSVFAPDGASIAGPSPRGMDTLPITIKDGRLMVRYEYFENLVPMKIVVS